MTLYKKDIILLAVVAFAAIIGIVIMLKFSSTGAYAVSNRYYPYPEYGYGRAAEVYGTQRSVKAGVPGKQVALEPRTGRFEHTGFQLCSSDYPYQISMDAYNAGYGYYNSRCIGPEVQPSVGNSIMCCKSGFSPR